MKNKVDFLKGYAKGLKLDEKTDDVSRLLSSIIDCIDSMADQIDNNTVEIDDMNDTIEDLQDSIDDLEDSIDELDDIVNDLDDFDDFDDFDDIYDDDDDDDPDDDSLDIDLSDNMGKNDIIHDDDNVAKTKHEINALTEELLKLVSSLSDNKTK